jgi:asparagine synthase (glutamine-hydrolysing)
MDDSQAFNILLSGGIDSSVVAAAAAELTADIDTVCVGVEESADIEMARKVSEHLGTNHKERVYDLDEMIRVLDKVVYASESFDYPLVRSCIPNYLAVQAFKDRRRITLCGEGGDEVFAGYDYMRDIRSDRRLRNEREQLLTEGYLTGFQRVDRMTASASLDGRMPIMSGSVIEHGLALNREDLFGPLMGQNKLALRKAFEPLLPKEVVWRRKQRFSDGAGSMHAPVQIAEMTISTREFKKECKALPKGRIRTKEELLYYRHFTEHFDSESAVAAVGFTPRP